VNRDLAFGVAGVVVAAGYYWLAASIPDSALADAVGPQGLPIAYAAVLLLLSLILIARALRTVRLDALAQGERNSEPGTSAHGPRIPTPGPRIPDAGSRLTDPGFRLRRVAGMLAIGVVYIVVVPWLGYVPTLAGLILVTTWYQSEFVTRTTALVAIAGAIVFWLVFVALLGIPQPPGIWAGSF
jgi:hypothetical protein